MTSVRYLTALAGALPALGACSSGPSETSAGATGGQDAASQQPDSGADARSDVDAAADSPPDDPNVAWREGDCAHPRVERRCADGWCAIPSGCFIIGSPADELGRGMYSEDQVPVTLTHPFVTQQHELTQREWTAFGIANPSRTYDGGRDCSDSNCSVGNITWFEAAAFANLASEKHVPRLPPCYRLESCTGKLGENMVCDSVAQSTSSIYECQGFRLPTQAEWEYVARAGTRTAFYSGGFLPDTTYSQAQGCGGEAVLDPIAWYCANSGNVTRPVNQKQPNGWGLFDMLGNAGEWMHDHWADSYRSWPRVDPQAEFVANSAREIRGGLYVGWPTILRAAAHSCGDWWGSGSGLRLVKTGTDNPGPLAGKSAGLGPVGSEAAKAR